MYTNEPESRTAILESQLHRFQGELRRLKRTAAVISCLLFIGLPYALWPRIGHGTAIADEPSSKMRTRRRLEVGELIIVNAAGERRASLHCRHGYAKLELCDEDGRPRLELGFHREGSGMYGPHFEILSADGKEVCGLSSDEDGKTATFAIMQGSTGAPRINLGLDGDGNASINLYGEVAPNWYRKDDPFPTRLEITSERKGIPTIQVFKKGKCLESFPVQH